MSNPRLSIIPADAVLDPRLKARDLQVLCVFGRHIDRNGWCRRSQVKMAQEMGCARSTVQASIERLVAAGWLQKRVLSTPHMAGERDSAHEYRVVLDVPDQPEDAVNTPADMPAPPADISAPLPTLDRHPLPTHESAPMLTTPSLTATPQRVRDDLDELQEKLLDAVGEGNIQPHGCIDLSAILGLIAAGVDLETDILPTIRARAVKLRRPVGSWAYFTEPIRDAYNRRIEAGKGLLKPRATGEAPKGWVEGMSADEASEKWVKTLNFARPRAQWKTWLWGPPPGQDGCQVPADLMEARDLERNWFEEKAPEAA